MVWVGIVQREFVVWAIPMHRLAEVALPIRIARDRRHLHAERQAAGLGEFVQADLAATLQFLADEERAASRGGRISELQAARTAF